MPQDAFDIFEDRERRRHPAPRLGREAYRAACRAHGVSPRDDASLLEERNPRGLAEPHKLRRGMLDAEREGRRWHGETGFDEDATEPTLHALPEVAARRDPYTGLGAGSTWDGPQSGTWSGRIFVRAELPGHPVGWFVESDAAIPLVVGIDGTSATSMLRGRRASDGLIRDVSLVEHVRVLLDLQAGGFRVLPHLCLDDYLASPFGPAAEGEEEPAIEVIARFGREIRHAPVPGETTEALVPRAVQAGREAVQAALVERERILANHARFAAFVEGLPETIDRESYETSLAALGLEPHLDHELADAEATARWPSIGQSCGHAAIQDDERAIRLAAARLLDEARMRAVLDGLENAPSAPAP